MMVRRGESAVLNQMRDEILDSHPRVKIVDVPNFYDTSIFNKCEQMNYLMETLDIWTDIHPSLVTLPIEWEYKVSYGIVYSKKPSKAVSEFIGIIQNSMSGKSAKK